MNSKRKSSVLQFPEELQQAIIDYAGTRHDDHLCYDAGTPDCGPFEALMKAIWDYGVSQDAREWADE